MKASKMAAAAAILALISLIGPQTASATHARPKAATPFLAALVPAYQECAAPNRVHAAPLSYSSCNPPVQASPNLTLGSPDANGAPAKGVASIKFRAVGAPGGVDDQDVALDVEALDVRCGTGVTACGSANSAAGPDYVGQLEANTPFQLTDHNNGPTGSGSDAATVLQIDFPFAVACAATPDMTVGSTCSASTSLDAQVPGTVPEAKRMNMELDQVTIWDGGPDGDILTPDNSIFFVQGIFVP